MSLSSSYPQVAGPLPTARTTTAVSPVLCGHCGLAVPEGLIKPSGPQFCCNGCEAVHRMLSEAGLSQYYEYRKQQEALGPASPAPSALESELFAEFDAPAFHELNVEKLGDGSCQVELGVEGIHCAACVWLLERLPRLEPEVSEVRVDLGRRVIQLRWPSEAISLSRIAARVSALGYRLTRERGMKARASHRRELRQILIRIGIAGASAGNVMLMAFALYSGAFGDGAGTMAPELGLLFQWGSLLLSVPALLTAHVFFRGALSSLSTRVPHMDLPIALGISAAYIYGIGRLLTGGGELYFDSITTLIMLLHVGRYLQAKHQIAHAEAAELAAAVTPSQARRLSSAEAAPGSGALTATSELQPGDLVEVARGEAVPVDGRVLRGRSTLDLSLLSGESRPVPVQENDEVLAGATNLVGRLVIQVERAGADTRAGQLMRSVERTLSERAPIVQLANSWAGVFTLIVLAVAALTALLTGTWFGTEVGLERGLAILVVACPCALGMATPLALSAAITEAARSKVLVKGPAVLEALARPALVVFDKTGTLTEGRLRVTHFQGSPELAALVSQAESTSAHPVAQALARDLAPQRPLAEPALRAEDIQEVPGRGLAIQTESGILYCGSEAFLSELGLAVPADPEGHGTTDSPVFLFTKERVLGVAWLGDEVRADAREALRALRHQGYRLAILSGDNQRVVDAVRRRLDPEGQLFEFAAGNALPETKLERVKGLAGAGAVFMVGDGINDAGALAAATVGIAVSGAAEASMLSADVYMAQPGIGRLVELLSGAARSMSTVRRGLYISLGYNVIGIALAALGLLGPLGAALLMPVSSLSVVTNAYRSRSFRAVGQATWARRLRVAEVS